MGKIFIGGTGRSGTTILGYTLSLHKRVFTLPFESRFIVDPGGVEDLVSSLCNYDYYKRDYAVREFIKLMKKIYPPRAQYLSKIVLSTILSKMGISPPKYSLAIGKHWKNDRHFSITKPPFSVVVPRDKFFRYIEDFLEKVVINEYNGFWTGYGFKIKPKIKITNVLERKITIDYSREFINNIMENILISYDKDVWVDHTPTNITHVVFLKELFPEMKFIHIYRDPRDVVSSYKTKHWGGNTTENASHILRNILLKWEEDKKDLSKETYIEISLEKLIENKKEVLHKLTEFLKIEFDENMLNVNLSGGHSGRWKIDLSNKEIKFVEKELGWFIEKFGYYDD